MLSNGWECPGCHCCYAPWVSKCTSCGPTKVAWTYTSNTTACEHIWSEPNTALHQYCTKCGQTTPHGWTTVRCGYTSPPMT